MAASPTWPRMTAPTAATVINVPTPILPRRSLIRVPGTKLDAPTASAAAVDTAPAVDEPARLAMNPNTRRAPASCRPELSDVSEPFGLAVPGLLTRWGIAPAATCVAHRATSVCTASPTPPTCRVP